MKRYKILITLLIVVFSFSVLFVPQCSAGSSSFTLKQLMDGGSLFAYGYVNSTTETTLTANTSHWTECVRVYGGSSYSFYGFDVMSNDSTLFSNFPDGSLLTLSTGRFVWAFQDGGVPRAGVWKMRLGFRILLSDGTFDYVYTDWYNNTSYGSSEPSFGVPYLGWDPIEFSTYLPDNCERIYSFTFEFTAVDGISGFKTTGVQYFMMWNGRFNFFIGPLSDAPVYEGPDTSGYDEYHASEDALLNDTADGRESVGSAIDNGFSALAPGGTLYNSMYFWRELMNDAINQIPMLSPMITVSLAFGIVVFILGGSLVKVLTRDPDNKVSRKRGKDG